MEIIPRKRHLDGVTVACPIVCGSIAHWLGKKADESATHKWTLYVRGPNNEDLSTFVAQVAFTLHPSFSEPVRGTSHDNMSPY
jgi:YEATS domain-containing protein 4